MPDLHMHTVRRPAGDYIALWTGAPETAQDLEPFLTSLAGPQLEAFTRVTEGRAHTAVNVKGPDGEWTIITWCDGDCQATVQRVTDMAGPDGQRQAAADGRSAYTLVADGENGPWALLEPSAARHLRG